MTRLAVTPLYTVEMDTLPLAVPNGVYLVPQFNHSCRVGASCSIVLQPFSLSSVLFPYLLKPVSAGVHLFKDEASPAYRGWEAAVGGLQFFFCHGLVVKGPVSTCPFP